MRKIVLQLGFIISIAANAQQAWTQRADVGYHQPNSPDAQWFGAAFSIDGFGYVVCGQLEDHLLYSNNTLRFDPSSGSWELRAAFPGLQLMGGVGITTNNKGYVFGGSPGPGNELWEYDPITDSWTQKATLPGAGRTYAVSFILNNKVHICTGNDNSSGTLLQDHWMYDPTLDQWTQLDPVPGPARSHAIAFELFGKGYVGTGTAGGIQSINDL